MKKNKYLLLASSIGSFALLLSAAIQENFFQEWRKIQRAARTEEGPVPLQLRQVVNPVLGIADRCVSCHVSMGAGEQGVTGSRILVPHKPVAHDPAEFGCTICHGGQGRATQRADAHGEVAFWPEPMLPTRFSYAGCGTCHIGLGVPETEQLTRAAQAFERLDCLACHKLNGRGGTIRPDGLGLEGPDLSASGLRGYDRDWYPKHVKKSAESAAGPWRTSFAPVSPSELELLRLYLDTRMGARNWVGAKAVFLSRGCLGCHKLSGVGGDEGPDLSLAGLKDPGQLAPPALHGRLSLADWMAEHFRSPLSVVAGSQMPPVPGTEAEIEQLTFYTLSLRRRDLPGSYLPKDRLRVQWLGEREFASDGATLFGAFCSGCHGSSGAGVRAPGLPNLPSIASPDFLGLVSDEFLTETVRRGRPGRKMPAWGEMVGGLRPEEIREVVAYLRRLGGVQPTPDPRPRRWVKGDHNAGRRLFLSLCSGCHGQRGEGGEGPALNNPVLLETATDTYIVETIRRGRRQTTMEGFQTPSPVRSALSAQEIEDIVTFIRSWEGAKQ